MYKDRFLPVVKFLNIFLGVISLAAVASLIGEYGFYLSPQTGAWFNRINIFIVWYFVFQALLKIAVSRDPLSYLKARWFDYLLVAVILVETLILVHLAGFEKLGRYLSGQNVSEITRFYIVAFQISFLFTLVTQSVRINQKIAAYRIHPAQVLIGSFFIIILLGTGLLMLPRATLPGNHLSFLDALFTSTSATCVTGLIVVDTGSYFSRFGQVIIMMLIQIGGLGLMTFSSFFALILRRQISLREKSMMKEIMNYENYGIISKLLSTTVLFTFTIELIGFFILYLAMGPEQSGRFFSALFHSISAFCNAGFSLYRDNFAGFQFNYVFLSTIMLLIVLGGLGFPVLLNLAGGKFRPQQKKKHALTVQTKLVLLISGILIVLGTVVFVSLESHNVMAGKPWHYKIINGLFQSITTRTAGFNTVNISQITFPVVIFFLFLMFVGASPASTGGGIKTTTFGILTAGVLAVIRRRNRIEMFHKTVPYTVLNRAIVIVLFSIFFVFVVFFVLTITEPFKPMDILFETFSAFGTVGLSRGITPDLSPIGKTVIVVAMFFGRLGALTISLAIATPRDIYHYDYPKENVMVG